MGLSAGKRALVEIPIIRLHGHHLPERLMRAVGVVVVLEPGQPDIGCAHARLAVVELVELAGLAALARSTQPLCLGLLGGSTNSSMPRRRQAVSNSATDSLPPSTSADSRSNGTWRIRWSRNAES